MSKLHFKGGPWTNTEDQFLLAGLNKYGLRDWARVASVLQNKTAQQCRERYENYLDDGLNLTEEWSLEEEEELLKLQSLFPYKWRTISEQITRRTSTHYRRPPWLCEQHYQQLLDAHEFEKKQAAAKQDGEPEMSFGAFMEERRRRRGKLLSHEERAARADTAATATEQRESHDLLVSRLANQDQKKGLRKQRKQQQQETSYLAKLENNREAIEAGTLSGRQRKRMRQAMEEDRQGRATVLDRIVEDEDDDEDDGDEYDDEDRLAIDDVDDEDGHAVAGNRKGAARSGGGRRVAFTPVDMQEDQAKAGIEKRSRKLYGGQLEAIAAKVAGDGKDVQSDGSLAIQHSVLDRLVAPDSASAPTAGRLLTQHGVKPSPSAPSSSGITWDALAGPNTDAPDLDALFAALPEAGMPATKHARTEKSTTTTPAASAGASAAAVAPVLATSDVDDIFASLPPLEGHSSSSSGDVRRAADQQETGASHATVPVPKSTAKAQAETHAAVRIRSPAEHLADAKQRIAEAMQAQDGSMLTLVATHDEAFMAALAEARRSVSDELARQTTPISAEVVAQTQQAMQAWVDVTVRDDELEALAGRVEEEASIAAARRDAAFARLERLVALCFVDPEDAVLAGGRYLVRGALTLAADGTDESATGRLLHYVAHYWAAKLARRREQSALVRTVREEEVAAMQQCLDALATELEAVVAEERRLQGEYRERQLRAQAKRSA